MKKCKKCGAPLEGFLYNTIGKLLGLKPSAKDPEMCNKCETEQEGKVEANKAESEAVVAKPSAPEAPAAPESEQFSSAKATEDEEKDDLIS